MRALAALLASRVLAVPAAASALGTARPAQRDWTQVVSQTPEGGFRMGNPQAAIRIVEFLSLTCPHCAEFSQAGTPQLMNHVRSGRVSLEYRNFVLNGLDLAASFLSRCASPQSYFPLTHAILASQGQWVGRMQALTPAQQQAMDGQPPLETMRRVVAAAGLDAIAARHGITPAQQRACLSNQAGLDRVLQMQQAGTNYGVTGTPTFAINGRIAGSVHNWASLEPLLRGR
ncbi:thioredoxin domain-containing protein [Sphingosinicella sp.]|uniref:thioredoxin domain-containing protein n=1 Tax=Sphingosinicella sp. TaxID=1917971 RepID=UPI0040380A0C